MDSSERQSLSAIPLILGIAVAITWAGSQHGVEFGGVPVFAWCAIFAFAANWLVFVPAHRFKTERYFDLTGSITYTGMVVIALVIRGPDPRSLLLGILVTVWALRLGSFLFARIQSDGSDGRFDAIKLSLPRFLMAWTLQALWVLLTLSCALAAMTTARPLPLGGVGVAGALVWTAGFAIEVLADQQKRRFRSDPRNTGRFIQSGLWSWSRHPNYFGEIVLWIGIALLSVPVLSGWQHATLISPVFVYVLLTRISGIPLLEARERRRWADDPEYEKYKRRTALLAPRPPRPI